MRYRGQPATVDIDVAIAQSGGVQIELIRQNDDLAGALAHFGKIGMPAAIEGNFGQVCFAYVDTRPGIGCMTELVGRDPIRYL